LDVLNCAEKKNKFNLKINQPIDNYVSRQI